MAEQNIVNAKQALKPLIVMTLTQFWGISRILKALQDKIVYVLLMTI